MNKTTDIILPNSKTIQEAICACERSLGELALATTGERQKGVRRFELLNYNKRILLPRLRRKLEEAKRRELFGS